MIKIDTLKVKNHHQHNSFNVAGMNNQLRDIRKNCTIVINTNSIDIDLIKSMLKYRKNIKKEWKKGKNTDSLFLYLTGDNHTLIRFINKYNKNLIGLTYKERQQLDKVRKNSYITQKYSFKAPTDQEYGYYEPKTNNYNDDNFKNQSIFYNKRINYEKIDKKTKTNIVDSTLKHCTDLITDFKLSDLQLNLTDGIPFIDIFNKRIKACDYRLKRNYWRVQKRYSNYQDFIKSIVYYGTLHQKNNRFWQIVKRELY